MERENRYLVIKRSDIAGIKKLMTPEAWSGFESVEKLANQVRVNRGKGPLCCVVVEHDWPEYETVWGLIEKRVDGSPTAEEIVAMRIQGLQRERDELRELLRAIRHNEECDVFEYCATIDEQLAKHKDTTFPEDPGRPVKPHRSGGGFPLDPYLQTR